MSELVRLRGKIYFTNCTLCTGEIFKTLEKYSRHRRNIQDTEEIFKTLENMKINKRGEGKKEGVVDK